MENGRTELRPKQQEILDEMRQLDKEAEDVLQRIEKLIV